MAITVEQARQILASFDSKIGAAVLEGMTNGLNLAALVSATKFFTGSDAPRGSRDPFLDPANPPPGPLKIRSGDLRRGTQVEPPRALGSLFVGALTNAVPYAPIHEFGGTVGGAFITPRSGNVLAFPGKDGNLVFRKSVTTKPGRVAPRPFLGPAVEEVELDVGIEIGSSVGRLLNNVLAG
jgi:hypothetical protein